MLTAARAWVGPPQLRRHGVGGGCDHLHRHDHVLGEENGARKSLHHRKLGMTQVGLVGGVTTPPPPAVCNEGVEADAGLRIRYSRKRKKQEGGSADAEEEDGSGAGGAETKAGKGDQVRAAMGSSANLVCSDCGTSRTPLWRKGPAGPKSLCNACRIRYRKAKRAGGPFPNATATAPAAPGGDQQKCHPRANPNAFVSLKLTAAAAAAEQVRKQREDRLRGRQRRRREVLWLLLEESRKFELPCGREAVEAAVLLMAMSSGLFVRSY